MGVWVLIVVLGVAFWSRGFEDFTERPHLVLGIVIFTLITAVPLAHYGSKAVSKHVYKMLEDGARIRRDAQLKTQKNKLKQFNAELISQLELTEQQLKSLQGLGV
jgi:hypothetical protein